MNQLYHMNQAMEYIEEHLDEEIDFQKVAQLAMTSETYFKRLFSFLAGMSLSEYIRNRRLSKAAFELKDSQVKVIDLSVKYGYTSPDSFSRAFQQLHGLTPTEARKLGSQLKSYPMLNFRLTIEGGEPLDYRIVEKEAFTVAGYRVKAVVDSEGNSEEIESFIENLTEEQYGQLAVIDNGLFEVSPMFLSAEYIETDEGDLQDFYVGVPTNEENREEFDQIDIPASEWAVFTVKGDWSKGNDIWTRIYTEWIPSTNYDPVNRDFMLATDDHTEIWIAVK